MTEPLADVIDARRERDALLAGLAVLRAQRDAALAECEAVTRTGGTLIVARVRAALGVQPEPDLASVEEADMQAEHDAEFHGGPV